MNVQPFKAFAMPAELEARWEGLISEARVRIEAGDGQSGLTSAKQAWDLIPEPRVSCNVSYITLLGMVKGFVAARAYDEGIEMMEWVLEHNPFARQIPVFLVQKGILEFEAGLLDAARISFKRAWKLAKDFGFKTEDPKYLAFLRNVP